jgi:RHS repeat-associated protein
MEHDAEMKNDDYLSYTTEFRQYDPRVGRWMSVDILLLPAESPFAAMSNNPVFFMDPLGASSEGYIKRANGRLDYDASVHSQADLDKNGSGDKYLGEEISGWITGENGDWYHIDGDRNGNISVVWYRDNVIVGDDGVSEDPQWCKDVIENFSNAPKKGDWMYSNPNNRDKNLYSRDQTFSIGGSGCAGGPSFTYHSVIISKSDYNLWGGKEGAFVTFDLGMSPSSGLNLGLGMNESHATMTGLKPTENPFSADFGTAIELSLAITYPSRLTAGPTFGYSSSRYQNRSFEQWSSGVTIGYGLKDKVFGNGFAIESYGSINASVGSMTIFWINKPVIYAHDSLRVANATNDSVLTAWKNKQSKSRLDSLHSLIK